MQFASALSEISDPQRLAEHLVLQVNAQHMPATVDLVLLFVNAELQPVIHDIAKQVRSELHARHILAVTAESVIGTDKEIERKPAASLLAMHLPDVSINAFHIADDEWETLLTDEGAFREKLEFENLRAFILFGDPFTTPAIQLLDACSAVFPHAPVVGGMASGITQAGQVRLLIDDDVHSSGCIGVSFAGNVQVDFVVSQGCRPVGHTFTVTKATKNVIFELDGESPVMKIETMLNALPESEQQFIRANALLIGRAIDEAKGNFGQGDFLIRSVLGVQAQQGSIVIGDLIRAGQTVQMHVRDAASAHEELKLLLEGEMLLADVPAGALLFSCNGRGTRMFDAPHHDVGLARQVLGNVPIAGFFAAGEFGPVGRRNFMHGQTASFALFRPAAKSES